MVSETKYAYTFLDREGKSMRFTLSYIDSVCPLFLHSNDRGKILESFTKVEFLLGQIVLAKMYPNIDIDFSDIENMNFLEEIIDNISFSQRIKIIKSYIKKDKKLDGILINLCAIRNQLAHLVEIKFISYNEKNLNWNYDEFRKDFLYVWEKLIDVYCEIWDQNKLYLKVCEEYVRTDMRKEDLI